LPSAFIEPYIPFFIGKIMLKKLRINIQSHCLIWFSSACLIPMLSGCIAMAVSLDHASMDRQFKTARKQQIDIIKRLQADGNPMGDYLFAVANAEKWWPENPITDPLVIQGIYEKAAARGSSDAMIALGRMLIFGDPTPPGGGSSLSYLKFEQRDAKKGLDYIRKGISTRCFYVVPNPDFNQQCFSQFSPAREIGIAFRDGFQVMDKNGKMITLIQKNQQLSDYWYKEDASCEASTEIRWKILACQ
jgi:hypothetical protein